MNRQKLILVLSNLMALTLLVSCVFAEMAEAGDTDSVFLYREIFLPESTGENAKKLGLNSLDDDWAIWGHNLGVVLPEKPSENIYAKKGGVTLRNQYCFMSDRLYDYIVDYIENKYDDEDHVRIAILPNDNEIVCLDSKCVEIGNTKHNASPALFNMIDRLARRFPNHLFFTSYYRTARGLPKDSLPENVGVLISAMDYPLSAVSTPKEQEFMRLIQAWKQKTGRILIWDYINNFDDYFTPYPIFDIMQRRLQNYVDNGVTAIFLNGSGNEYSSFSGIKAEVLAKLTADPNIEWRPLLQEIAKKHYPVTGDVIADFIISQEDFVKTKGKALPLYEGVEKAVETYLPEELFVEFHNKLRSLKPQTEGKEREYVERLVGSMALTRLELNRMKGVTRGAEELLEDLRLLKNQNNWSAPFYSEACWTVDNYISDYDFLLKTAKETEKGNRLKGEKLVALNPLDPDYSDISILTDGVLGIPSNYHSGNLIMSPDSKMQIAIPYQPGMKKLRVGLSYNPAYRVALPAEVTLREGGKNLGTVYPDYGMANGHKGHVFLDFDVPGNTSGTLILTLFKDPDTHSMAVDEIFAFK